jgi:hypothetical protein
MQPQEIRSTPAAATAGAVSGDAPEALSEGNASSPRMKWAGGVMELTPKAFRSIDDAVITSESEDIRSVWDGFRREGAQGRSEELARAVLRAKIAGSAARSRQERWQSQA